jgi:hypothetical protein
MKRADKPMMKSGGMKRLDSVRKLGMRPALGFIGPAPDPITSADPDAPPEVQENAAMSDVLRGFKERAKAEAIRFAETTRTDYYFCVVFEHGDQANAFLRKCGMPDQEGMFIDGTMLAKALDIELPPSPFKLRALRSPDRSLNALVTAIPARGEMKRLAAIASKPKPK